MIRYESAVPGVYGAVFVTSDGAFAVAPYCE